MIAKVPPRKKHTSRFKRLIYYITLRKNNMLTDNRILAEDEDITVMLNQGVICEHNLISLELALIVMQAVAKHNTKIKSPVYQCILSWAKEQHPSDTIILNCASHVLNSLNIGNHQYVFAIHRDTLQSHVHIDVNRVNPETYKSLSISNDYYTLDYAIRVLEIQYDFKHDNEAYEVYEKDEQKIILPSNQHKKRDDKHLATIRAKEIHSDKGSLLSFVRDKPRKAWLMLLKKEVICWPGCS